MKGRFFKVIIAFLALVCYFPVKAETYVVAVGIAKYKYISGLALPENDAKTMANLYKHKTKKAVTLTGHSATRSNILKALSVQFHRAKKGDMVVFFFSGHGYEGGFCPYDIRENFQNALSYQDIYSVFRKSKATRKVIFADACMSGGLRRRRINNHHLYQKKSDVVMFLSSRTKEYSMESRKMRNGYFTAFLEKGLRGAADFDRNKIITAKEIFRYVSKGVRNVTENKQHPVMWGNFRDNFVMMNWKY